MVSEPHGTISALSRDEEWGRQGPYEMTALLAALETARTSTASDSLKVSFV